MTMEIEEVLVARDEEVRSARYRRAQDWQIIRVATCGGIHPRGGRRSGSARAFVLIVAAVLEKNLARRRH